MAHTSNGSRFERLLKFIERPCSVRFIVGIKLWTYRIHQSVRRSYRHKYGHAIERDLETKAKVSAAGGCSVTNGPEVAKNPPQKDGGGGGGDWEWRDFASLPPIFIYYEHFTTVYLILTLWRNVMPQQLISLTSWLKPQMAPHCYSPGHLVANKAIEFHVETLLAIYNLLWRLLMYLRKRPHVFSLYIFLTISERDLNRFAALIATEAQAAHTTRSEQSNVSLDKQQAKGKRLAKCSGVERMFKSTLCYKIYLKNLNEIVYKLKPNRTPSAQRDLRHHLAKVVVAICSYYLVIMISIVILVVYQILDSRRYHRLYPDCQPISSSDLIAMSSSSSGSHFNGTSSEIAHAPTHIWLPLTWHALTMATVDLCHNFVVWMETGVSVLVAWVSTYFINYDTIYYWRKLNQKLEQVYKRVLNEHELRKNLDLRDERIPLDEWEQEREEREQEQSRSFRRKGTTLGTNYRRRAMMSVNATSGQVAYRVSQNDQRQLEIDKQIHQLLVEFYSLFGHIREVDTIVSDIITTSIFVWVSLFAVLGHLAINQAAAANDWTAILVIVGLESFVYFVYTVGCFSVLRLRNKCHRSYKTFCSLMAYDASQHKEGLTKLLDYFVGTKCFAYTVFSQYPFTKTTYLSIIGWSFSFFFIVEGVRKR